MGRPVQVVPWDAEWPARFEAEADALRDALVSARAIHHVGSTSVAGLPAKPVIDILVEVTSLGDADADVARMTARGYESRGEYGIPGRRYFLRGPAGAPAVHIHCFVAGHPQIEAHLLFRDYLRGDSEAARAYGALKASLAIRYADDRKAYQAAKAPFIADLHARASLWRTRRGSVASTGPDGS